MPSSGQDAERCCVGCRQRDGSSMLLRFIAQDGQLLLDASRKFPGRGAWAHARIGCLERGLKRGGFARSLHAPVKDELDRVVLNAEKVCGQQALSILGLLRRSGGLKFGRVEALKALSLQRVAAMWLAADAAGRTSQAVYGAASRLATPVYVVSDQKNMGLAIGSAPVAVIALPNGPAGQRAMDALACWEHLVNEATVYKRSGEH